jgi:phage host-nuclease inhibitor protein Gam
MIQAVITRYELLRAEERKDAWRKTRQSGCYQHSTPAAQKILDRTNQKYTEEITRLNKTLNSSLKRVVQYSDGLNAHRDLLQKGVDKKTIRMYTDELRDWVVDLDLSKRVSIAAAMIDQEKTEREAIKQEEKEKGKS